MFFSLQATKIQKSRFLLNWLHWIITLVWFAFTQLTLLHFTPITHGCAQLQHSTHPWAMGLPGGTSDKESTCQSRRLEIRIRSLGQEDPLEAGIGTHSGILAWRITQTEEPGGLQSIGLQRVKHDWRLSTHTHPSLSYQTVSHFSW